MIYGLKSSEVFVNGCSFCAVWWVDFSFLRLPRPFFFLSFLILLFVSCRDEYQPLVILTQFRVTDGTCLKNQKLNTLLQENWKFECHFNAAKETKKATYECTELKYVETKCLFSESQRHAVSLLEVFISYKSEIVICEVSFLIFFPGVLSPACMHQQGAQDCGELCSSWVQYVSGDS